MLGGVKGYVKRTYARLRVVRCVRMMLLSLGEFLGLRRRLQWTMLLLLRSEAFLFWYCDVGVDGVLLVLRI